MKVVALLLVFLTVPGYSAKPGLSRRGGGEGAAEERSGGTTRGTTPEPFSERRDASEEEREGELVAGVRHRGPAGGAGHHGGEEPTVPSIARSPGPHHIPHTLPVTPLPVASSGPPPAAAATALGRALPTAREDPLKELLRVPARPRHHHHHQRLTHNELEENTEEAMVENILRTKGTPPTANRTEEEKAKKTNVTSRVEAGTPTPKVTADTTATTKAAKSPGNKVAAKLPGKTGNDKSKTVKNGRKKDNKTKKPVKVKPAEPTHFPYFLDNYCPPECACYGRVVQCSDKGVERVPYGIPYNARYVLLMNNLISSIQLDLLSQYVSMEFLVLSNNRLTDAAVEGAFEGIPALKRLYLDRNRLASVPADLPHSLEELRLDDNRLAVMSAAAWARCPGLRVLSLSNNSLADGSLAGAPLSPLRRLRTLNLDHNRLTAAPLGLPPSVRELYLKGNLIREFGGGAFDGPAELLLLDLSANRLADRGLGREALANTTRLESLNLAGNRLKQVPRHLPPSLKTLNLEGNLIATVKRGAFAGLPLLEHLGLARNRISEVLPGAFRALPALHQLDLSRNALRQAPRRLPRGLHTVALARNRIEEVPRDAFCWGGEGGGPSGLVRVQLEDNRIDMGRLDARAFRCLRGFQVVHFY